MLFVLGTGRNGSLTMARLLNQFTGIEAYHEKPPELVKEARYYLKGELPEEELVDLLRRTRKPSDAKLDYAESNQKLSFVIPALRKAFPEASYVWLVRNGLDVVSSWTHKRNYRPDENKGIWSAHRIRGDEAGEMTSHQWKQLSPFARCCWYWAWTNRRIETDLKATNARWMLVPVEKLSDMAEAIASFAGTTVHDGYEIPVENVSKGTVSGWHYWDASQRREFNCFCAPIMDRLYPGWQNDFKFTPAQLIRNEVLRSLSHRSWSGQLLRKIAHVIPQSLRRKTARLFKGSGVLNYPLKDSKP